MLLEITCSNSGHKWELPRDSITYWTTQGCYFILYIKHEEPLWFFLENENAVLRFLISFREAFKSLIVKDQKVTLACFIDPELEEEETNDTLGELTKI